MEECNYERHVRHFFDLPKSTNESDKIGTDFGVLVNLLAAFETDLKKQLAEEKHRVETWKAMLRMELSRCEGLVSDRLQAEKDFEAKHDLMCQALTKMEIKRDSMQEALDLRLEFIAALSMEMNYNDWLSHRQGMIHTPKNYF